MRSNWKLTLIFAVLIVGVLPAVASAQAQYFGTSQHATRSGKAFWYSADNGGFEAFTDVPIEDLGCQECHGGLDANGVAYESPYPGMDCSGCHATETDFSVSQTQCYSCHGRQATEALKMGFSDVHRDAGMVCWDCHSSGDVHGDGTEYVSMLDPGAIDADCENCHNTLDNPLSAAHAAADPHNGALHCASCHAETVISCYNCHFESAVEHHVKRAKQPLAGFVMLANRAKDGKVYPMSFQSVTNQGDAFVAFGPYTPHTIKAEGRTCPECHNMAGSNAAITEYNDSGKIRFAQWDDATDTLSWVKGVIPIPEDYEETLKMDFITYDGDTSDPAGPSSDWSSIGKDTWDGHQMLYASPLTKDQMSSLGFVVPNEPPVVDAGGPYTVAVGVELELNASGTTDPEGDSMVYLWDFGDGSTPPMPSDSPVITHTYAEIGIYTALLAVTDGTNDPILVEVEVEVTEAPPLPESDTWEVQIPLLDTEFTVTLEDFAGFLIVRTTQPNGQTSVAIGMEFDGVIFWMDTTGAIYFGNVSRAAGTMSGIVFGYADGTSSIWLAEMVR